jgi:hypothetical protein
MKTLSLLSLQVRVWGAPLILLVFNQRTGKSLSWHVSFISCLQGFGQILWSGGVVVSIVCTAILSYHVQQILHVAAAPHMRYHSAYCSHHLKWQLLCHFHFLSLHPMIAWSVSIVCVWYA